VTGLDEFDRYCAESEVPPEDVPVAVADWLANLTGQPIIGRPAGEPRRSGQCLTRA
jgi:hypothetical protein